jgi:6-phospho-beta-glucosidase
LEEGYTGVALRLVEALSGQRPGLMILNVANRGSVCGMRDDAVVEVPCEVGLDRIRPLAVGQVPGDCLALMTVVKEYERLTIEAASTCSMKGAMAALTANPLVPDRAAAEAILDGYLAVHREYLNLG